MRRSTFLVIAAAASLPLTASRRALATERVLTVRRLGRADRSMMLGAPGGCASQRARRSDASGGFTLADVY